MIKAVASYCSGIPPVFIDGCLFVLIAWFIFNQSYFGGDEASKFISPVFKFWLNWVIGSGATMFGALKMFRSTSYAQHQENKKGTGNTDFFQQQTTVTQQTNKTP
jgi:hypothetical protein